ncbi:hypothetical protein KKB40_06620 [Patescibacteria group bacterium]|nr:hypothetical protein [Patescibacteria group bacterium]
MAVLEIPKKRLIGPSIKALMEPALVVCVTAVLFFILLKTSYIQINLQLSNLEMAKRTEGILEEKVFILRQIKEGVLEYTNTSVTALPEKNPAPVIISQLKAFSRNSSVNLDKIKSGTISVSGENVSMAQLSVEVESAEELSMIIDFINTLPNTLPLLTINNIEMTGLNGEPAMKLTASYYWSAFPTQLPPITEPIKDLLPNERVLLSELSSFLKPSFTVLQPTQPRERANPFN